MLGIFLLGLGPVKAQAPATRPDTARVNQAPPVSRKAQAAADSAKRTERLFGLRLTRPGKAALLAAVLPGAGQVYNRSWWKLPLVYGALGGVGYGEYFYQSRFREYVDAEELVATGTPIGSTALGPRARQERSLEAIQRGIQFYRGYRDIFILYCGLAYGLQIVDALVDAHLRDFDVSDDLALHWEPTLMAVPGRASALPTAPGVMFALKLK
ncbi:hypothetical protein GCM10023185_43890 [Hymenobacter saemangeumensis]|uniref:DUF5683 domain-containing protein n=1 Tax=Hymenobacter saemangeumensis TaxID=1084522 RepID=A0ABP8IS50_9BACT